ncbi:hypothetical protein CC79DRAFT_1323948 [Sarocladium strictum]
MGWLWASPSPEKPSTPVQNQSAAAQAAAPNEPVDPEIQKFFDMFKSDSSTSSTGNTSQSASATQTASTSQQTSSSSEDKKSWFALRSTKPEPTPEAPPLSPLSESLLPTEISCRTAFDQAWACNGFGGQWNAVYRYGSMRSCSEQWDDFWFCMRTRTQSGKAKEDLVRARYREKEWRKYGPGKPSSEDIWESRDRKVDPDTVFTKEINL